MEKPTEGHSRVIELTHMMLDAARADNLQGLISLEKERDELLQRVCEKRREFFPSEESFHEFARQVMELDEILGELVRQEKDILAMQLSQLQGRRKAATAYVTVAD